MINQFDPFNSRMQRGRDNGNNAARTEHTTNDAQGKKMYENKEDHTKMFNIIILDRSGSMSSIKKQAVDGLNKTIGTIKSAQKENYKDQEHLVGIYAFCGCGIETLVCDEYCENVKEFSYDDYNPCCMTPLYDAMGNVLSYYEKMLSHIDDAVGVVTVITDGYENASKQYTEHDISKLISRLSEKGWLFTYIGTDHDVQKVAMSINITNTLKFEKTEEGTQEMWEKENTSRQNYYSRMAEARREAEQQEMSVDERNERYKKEQSNFFDEPDEKK
ncbi:MAG: hypothetical protein LKF31_01935 [Muribaculaceae bacterium]|jgi:hypothetical protein|nr:hypothetical protein [Muribaculaceae bacterium]